MDPEKGDQDKVLEADFLKRAEDGKLEISGAIVFCHSSDQYEFIPAAGFTGCPSLEEMTQLYLKKASMTNEERDKDWDLKSPLDEFGLPAKLFCRVEEGNEIEVIDGICFHLNAQLGTETNADEKKRRHKNLLRTHRDIVIKDYKYQIRSNTNPVWSWERRHVYGEQIKYAADIMTITEKRRVRARRATSPSSSVASGVLSRTGSIALDIGADIEQGSEKEKSPPTEETLEPEKQPEPEAGPSTVPDKPPPRKMSLIEAMMGGSSKSGTETSKAPASDEGTVVSSEAPTEALPEVPSEVVQVVLGDEPPPTGSPPSTAAPEAPKAGSPKIDVTDEEIEAELPSVEIKNPLSEKLMQLYEQLPAKIGDVPEPGEDNSELKEIVMKLRPYQDQYHDEINKKRHPKVTVSKEMNKNVAKREFNAIKRLIEDRDKFQDKHYQLQWDEARRKALRKKRAEIRKREKEAKAAAKVAEKKSKIGPRSKTIEETRPQSSGQSQGASAVRALFETSFGIDPEAGDEPVPLSSRREGDKATDDQQQVSAVDVEDDSEEVIVARPSTSRSKPAPEAGRLPTTPRSKRAYLPDTNIESRFGVILGEVKDVWTEINQIKTNSNRELGKIANNTKAISKAIELVSKDLGEMKIRIFKQDMRQEMTMAKAERNVTRFLPIDMINETTRSLLGEDPSARAICARVWSALNYAGHDDPDLGSVVAKAATIIFSNELRSFMKVSDGSGELEEEIKRGWDRIPLPPEFYVLMEEYILKRWSGRQTPSKSPLRRNRKRTWKQCMVDNLRNTRDIFFQFVANEFEYFEPYIVRRHQLKKNMYVRNTHPDERRTTCPSLAQEKEWCVADTPGLRTVEDLKTTKIVRKKKEFPSKAGEFPDPDEVRNAINELAAVQTGLPAFAAELFNLGANQPLPDPVTINNAFQEEMERHQDFGEFEELGIHRNEASASTSRSRSVSPGKARSEGPKRPAKDTSPLSSASSPQKRTKSTRDPDSGHPEQ